MNIFLFFRWAFKCKSVSDYRLTPKPPKLQSFRSSVVAVPEMLICKNGNIKVFDCMICAVKLQSSHDGRQRNKRLA